MEVDQGAPETLLVCSSTCGGAPQCDAMFYFDTEEPSFVTILIEGWLILANQTTPYFKKRHQLSHCCSGKQVL